MFKKIIQLLVFLLLIDLINVACVCSHLKDYPKHCNGNFVGVFFNLKPNNSSLLFAKDTTIVMPFNNLALECALDIQTFNCVKNKRSGFIITQAQACKPAIVNITNMVDSITDFNITTVKNYNSNFIIDANINTILMHNISAGKTNKLLTGTLSNTQISDFYNINSKDIQDLNYIRHNVTVTQKPTNTGDTTQFAIAYTLSNGITLSDTTCKIVVTY